MEGYAERVEKALDRLQQTAPYVNTSLLREYVARALKEFRGRCGLNSAVPYGDGSSVICYNFVAEGFGETIL